MFQALSKVVSDDITLSMHVEKASHGKLTIMVIPKPKNECVELQVPPLVVTGTPADLDKGFSGAIGNFKASVNGLITNLKTFQSAAFEQGEGAKKEFNKKKPAKIVSGKSANGNEGNGKPKGDSQKSLFD